MTNTRYNRWQGLAIAQFSVAVALITAFSAAALGAGLSLLQNKDFPLSPSLHYPFAGSLFLLLCAVFFGCGAVITRTLDFRLTARKVRKDTSPGYSKALTIWGVGFDGYGRATWRLFWFSSGALFVGVALLVVCVGNAYAHRLF
jgi:hypothetical protein